MFFFKKNAKSGPVAESLDLRNVTGYPNAARERQLSNDIGRTCVEWFPDNEHNTWRVLRVLHVEERSYAEVEPEPMDVGHDRYVFVFEFRDGDADNTSLAVWCFEDGGYCLLSTAPECKETPPGKLLW